jgi:hypothetical protein
LTFNVCLNTVSLVILLFFMYTLYCFRIIFEGIQLFYGNGAAVFTNRVPLIIVLILLD